MKPILIAIVGVLLLAGVGVAVYPAARASYVRHRATSHLHEAGILQDQMTSPVAKQALGGAGDQVKFALMRSDTSVEDIAQYDSELVRLMASLRASPPPDHPIEVTVIAEPTMSAGETTTVRVTVHSLLAQVFLVNVSVQIGLDSGWRSRLARKTFDRTVDGTPIETTLEIQVPADVIGSAHVRAAVVYRLDPTGEGMDLQAQPADAPVLTITRGRS